MWAGIEKNVIRLPKMAQDMFGAIQITDMTQEKIKIFFSVFLLIQILIAVSQLIGIGTELAIPQFVRKYKAEKIRSIILSLMLLSAAAGNMAVAYSLFLQVAECA